MEKWQKEILDFLKSKGVMPKLLKGLNYCVYPSGKIIIIDKYKYSLRILYNNLGEALQKELFNFKKDYKDFIVFDVKGEIVYE